MHTYLCACVCARARACVCVCLNACLCAHPHSGLSYSKFDYSTLKVSNSSGKVTVSATVKNVGPGSGSGGSQPWTQMAAEISQLYVVMPQQPAPVVSPKLAMQGFAKVKLLPGDSQTLSFQLLPTQYCTVLESGDCHVFAGAYKVFVSGHQPDDQLGLAVSNVAAGAFEVASAWTVPRPDRG